MTDIFEGPGSGEPIMQPQSRRERRELEAAASRRKTRKSRTSSTAATTLTVDTVAQTSASVPDARSAKLRRRAEKAAGEFSRRKASRPVAPRPAVAARPPMKRRIAAKFTTLGAMAGVGLMFVSITTPASAFYQEPTEAPPTADVVEQQVMAVSSTASTAAVSRDTYSASSLQQRLIQQYGARSFAYAVNPTGAVQWPFPFAAPISSGFGPRVGCGFCSTWHKGLDLTPGAGTPIHSIAAGVVTDTQTLGWGLGHYVTVSHVINGQNIDSVYAHMQAGSINVVVGQEVPVGADRKSVV